GLANAEHVLRFVADTVLNHGFGFDLPVVVPDHGVLGSPRVDRGLPTVGVVFYRAHVLSGNTQFVTDLCSAIEGRGVNAVPLVCYSLRPDEPGAPVPAVALMEELGVDAVVTTVLAAGSSGAGGDGRWGAGWDPGPLAALD